MNSYQDNSHILSYNPDLTINTRPEVEAYQSTHYDESAYKSDRSTVLNQFEIHSPSKKVEKLNNAINQINILKENIKANSINKRYSNSYHNSNDVSEKEEILKENFEDLLHGDTTLEVYSMCENIKEEIENVKSNYIIAIYGKDIDEDKISEVDNAYVEKLDYYEFNNKHEYINYFNLYYDTQISFLIGEYADRISENIANLSLIEDESLVSQVDEYSEDIIRKRFNKNNELLTYDVYKNNINKEDLSTAISNVFLAKQDLNIYYDTFSDFCSLGDEYEVIYDIKKENMDILEEKLDILVQTVMMSEISKDDIYKTLQKKSKIRGFFER